MKLQWKSRVYFWEREYKILLISESLSYQSQCSEMIEQTLLTAEDSKKIFSFKDLDWKNNILVAEEKINLFSEKIIKKVLQEK